MNQTNDKKFTVTILKLVLVMVNASEIFNIKMSPFSLN
jgi:hypothetical protein